MPAELSPLTNISSMCLRGSLSDAKPSINESKVNQEQNIFGKNHTKIHMKIFAVGLIFMKKHSVFSDSGLSQGTSIKFKDAVLLTMMILTEQ